MPAPRAGCTCNENRPLGCGGVVETAGSKGFLAFTLLNKINMLIYQRLSGWHAPCYEEPVAPWAAFNQENSMFNIDDDNDDGQGQHYGFTFDLCPSVMKLFGVDPNAVYQKQMPVAMAKCGFTKHPEGSVYVTGKPLSLAPDEVIQSLVATLPEDAPDFGRFVTRCHLFGSRVDLTSMLSTKLGEPPPRDDMGDPVAEIDPEVEREFTSILEGIREQVSRQKRKKLRGLLTVRSRK